MLLPYQQRQAITQLAYNLSPTTLAAIVADLSCSEDEALKGMATICKLVGIGDCGKKEFTEMVAAALETSGPVYYTGHER